MTCQLNKPQCIRCQIPLTPITSNECLIFHTKELNSKASGPWSQLQLSSILDLDEKIKKDVQVCRVKLYKFEHKLHALHLTNLQLHALVYFTF